MGLLTLRVVLSVGWKRLVRNSGNATSRQRSEGLNINCAQLFGPPVLLPGPICLWSSRFLQEPCWASITGTWTHKPSHPRLMESDKFSPAKHTTRWQRCSYLIVSIVEQAFCNWSYLTRQKLFKPQLSTPTDTCGVQSLRRVCVFVGHLET